MLNWILENLILKETPKDFNQAQLIWSFDQFVYRNGTEAMEKCLVIYSFLKENGNNYAKYYLDGSIEQVLGLITTRSDEIDQEIAEAENQKEKLPGLLAEKQKLAAQKHSERMKGNNSSSKKKNRIVHEKFCENCGIHFIAKEKRTKYCSIKCAAIKREKNKHE